MLKVIPKKRVVPTKIDFYFYYHGGLSCSILIGFYEVLFRSWLALLFFLFILTIVLSIRRLTASVYTLDKSAYIFGVCFIPSTSYVFVELQERDIDI
jgi:hypothetical protein